MADDMDKSILMELSQWIEKQADEEIERMLQEGKVRKRGNPALEKPEDIIGEQDGVVKKP